MRFVWLIILAISAVIAVTLGYPWIAGPAILLGIGFLTEMLFPRVFDHE